MFESHCSRFSMYNFFFIELILKVACFTEKNPNKKVTTTQPSPHCNKQTSNPTRKRDELITSKKKKTQPKTQPIGNSHLSLNQNTEV